MLKKRNRRGILKKKLCQNKKKSVSFIFSIPWWLGWMMMTRRGGSARYVCMHTLLVLYSISSKTLANNKLACYYTYYICTSTYFPREKMKFSNLFFYFVRKKVGSTSSKTKCTTCYITRMQVTCISLYSLFYLIKFLQQQNSFFVFTLF